MVDININITNYWEFYLAYMLSGITTYLLYKLFFEKFNGQIGFKNITLQSEAYYILATALNPIALPLGVIFLIGLFLCKQINNLIKNVSIKAYK